MTTVPATRLMRKRRRERLPVTSASVALFRLGELCNNACPMCSNSGRPEAFRIDDADLLRRVDHLAALGFRRVVVTGGEPTIHPAFWDVVKRLGERSIAWDINTHGRSFSDPAFAERALDAGLERAIVSLHSHLPAISAEISGNSEHGHLQTVTGIDHLVAGGCEMMLNAVVCKLNVADLVAYVGYCGDRFGSETQLKIVFPYTGGKGGDWHAIALRYSDVMPQVEAARAEARRRGITMLFESFPNCILRDGEATNLSRSGFGETHYLEDIHGVDVFPIRHIEAALAVYPPACRDCAALKRCGGISEDYARRYGVEEFVPIAID